MIQDEYARTDPKMSAFRRDGAEKRRLADLSIMWHLRERSWRALFFGALNNLLLLMQMRLDTPKPLMHYRFRSRYKTYQEVQGVFNSDPTQLAHPRFVGLTV